MTHRATDHHPDCEWHHDQYPHECGCGVYGRKTRIVLREGGFFLVYAMDIGWAERPMLSRLEVGPFRNIDDALYQSRAMVRDA